MSLSAWDQRQSRWNRLHFCVVLLWFLALLLERFVTERGTLLIQNVLIPLSFLTAGGWMFRRREKAGADFWLLAGFLCWYAVTRILNGCHYLQDESGFLPRLACFILAIYPLAAEWKADRREKAFHFCLALFTGVLTILAWVSLYAAIRGEPVQPFSFARVIGFNDVYGARLNLWDLHPNVTAAIFVAGFGMSLCGVSLARRWPAKAAYAVAAVSLFAAASLTISRTAMIAASLEAAGFVFLLIAGRLPSKRKALCVVLALLLACGTAGTGIRVDGEANTLRIAPGVRVSADGAYGTGLLLAYGKGQNVVSRGEIRATGTGGAGARFDFGGSLLGLDSGLTAEYRGS